MKEQENEQKSDLNNLLLRTENIKSNGTFQPTHLQLHLTCQSFMYKFII